MVPSSVREPKQGLIMQPSIREMELILMATEFMGRARNGSAVSEELKKLHDKILSEHKKETNQN